MLKLKRPVIIFFFAAVFFVAGCSQDSPSVIRADIGEPVRNLDPQFATDPTARMIISNLFEGLIAQDSEGQLRLGAAAQYRISPDGLTYTFTLREDARWQDGSAVTSGDFVFAFQRMFSPHAPSPFAADFLAIANASQVMDGDSSPATLGVSARGPQTVVFTLERPYPDFLIRLAHTAAMPCNRLAFEQSMGRYGMEARYLSSNGPFTIGRWDASQLHLSRSEYFREEEQALSERVILYIGRQDPLRQFLDGRSDLVLIPPDRLDEVSERSAQFIPAQLTVWGLVFNQNARPWGSPLLRQSLALSFDPNLHSENLPANLAATCVFVPSSALVQGQKFRSYGDASSPLGLDSAQARRLFGQGLTALGYNHLPPSIIFVPENHTRHLEFLEETWQRELGAEITLVPTPAEQISQRLQTEDFGVMLLPFYSIGEGPGAFLRQFYSGGNRFGYNNPRFDHALGAASLATTREEITRLYALAEDLLLEDAAIIPVYFETSYYALSPGLTGVEVFPFGGGVRFQNAQKQ